MSFLKISDPLKRDSIIKEYLELKKKIRDNLLSERIGEQQLQTDLSKFYKPITETQKATAREITEGLKPIREGIENLPEAIQPLGKATLFIVVIIQKTLTQKQVEVINGYFYLVLFGKVKRKSMRERGLLLFQVILMRC